MPGCLMARQLNTYARGVQSYPVFVSYADGSLSPFNYALVLVPDPDTVDLVNCAAVSISGAEYMALTKAVTGTPTTGGGGGSGSLLDLSPEQAMPVAAAVFGVWAVAWAAKQAIRTLRGSDEKID